MASTRAGSADSQEAVGLVFGLVPSQEALCSAGWQTVDWCCFTGNVRLGGASSGGCWLVASKAKWWRR